MNILYGLYHADEGEILIDGAPVHFDAPGDAIAAGLGMVHQHFMLVPGLHRHRERDAGQRDRRKRSVYWTAGGARSAVTEISRRFGFDIPPDAVVEELPVGVQQRVEIVKALYREAKVLILDEPTAVLTPQETEELFRVMRALARDFKPPSSSSPTSSRRSWRSPTGSRFSAGVGSWAPATPSATAEAELASMMVGRDVELQVTKGPADPGDLVLKIEDLVVLDDRGHTAVDGVSLDVRAGEIVCVAGVQGNGQTELVEAITGLRPPAAGHDPASSAATSRDGLTEGCARAGVGHVPEDRQQDGLILDFSIADNLVLNTFDERAVRTAGSSGTRTAIRGRRRGACAGVRRPDELRPRTQRRMLSGGNQQKVIVAREFSRPIRLLDREPADPRARRRFDRVHPRADRGEA